MKSPQRHHYIRCTYITNGHISSWESTLPNAGIALSTTEPPSAIVQWNYRLLPSAFG
jgi:hypothetical protein